jgi:hypothetical protein
MDNFIYKKKWFDEALPANKAKASISIGTGDDGVVEVVCDEYGDVGNNYSLEVVAGTGNDVALSAVLADTKITVTLGTDGAGVLDTAKNTATLVAGAIDDLEGFVATASGTGETVFGEAIAEDNFAGGQWGTPCPEVNSLLFITPYYYLCTNSGNRDDVEWKRFTPAAY